jgi:hypothetical protein
MIRFEGRLEFGIRSGEAHLRDTPVIRVRNAPALAACFHAVKQARDRGCLSTVISARRPTLIGSLPDSVASTRHMVRNCMPRWRVMS